MTSSSRILGDQTPKTGYTPVYNFVDVTEAFKASYNDACGKKNNNINKGLTKVNIYSASLLNLEKLVEIKHISDSIADTTETSFDKKGRLVEYGYIRAARPTQTDLASKYAKNKISELTIGYDMEWLANESVRGVVAYNDSCKESVFCLDERSYAPNELILMQFYIRELDVGFVLEVCDNARFGLDELFELLLTPFVERLNFANLKITMLSHFGAAEFSHLSVRFKKLVLSQFATYKDFVTRKVPVTRRQPVQIKCKFIKNNAKRVVELHFRDTYLLTNESLEKSCEVFGMHKIEIGAHINNFKKFLRDEPEKAYDYAFNDAFLVVLLYEKITEKLKTEFGIPKVPITASGISVAFLRRNLSKKAYQNLGVDDPNGDYIDFAMAEVASCKSVYHGGLNCVYHTGRWVNTQAFDYDLTQAYGRSLMCLRIPNFKVMTQYKLDENNQVVDIVGENDLGMVVLKKWALKNCYQAYIPFSTDFGLVFPQSGENTPVSATVFGYLLRNDLFEFYEVATSKIFNTFDETSDELGRVISDLAAKRDIVKALVKSEPGNLDLKFQDAFIKLIINSCYGKFGQGVKTKIATSAITNPLIASFITDVCRLSVIENINFLVQRGYKVFSVTTDGFMVDKRISRDDMKDLQTLPMTRFVLNTAKSEKHLVLKNNLDDGELIVFRTRGYLMNGTTSSNLLLAKNGFKLPDSWTVNDKKDSRKVRDLIVSSIQNNIPNKRQLFPDADYIYRAPFYDLVKIPDETFIDFDPDFKRKLEFQGFFEGFPRFSTSNYATIGDAIAANNAKERFKKAVSKSGSIRQNFIILNLDNTRKFLFYYDLFLRGVDRVDEKFFIRQICIKALARGEKPAEIDRKLGVSNYAKKVKYELGVGNYRADENYPTDPDFYARHADYLGRDLLVLVKEYLLAR